MQVYLGIDGGGSSCRARAEDENGNLVYEGRSGAANWASTPRHQIETHLKESSRGCPAPVAVAACFAGLLTQTDRDEARMLLSYLFPKATVIARPDYEAALFACPPDRSACLISGTGSMACSQDEAGICRKAGGRGYILGDPGSGFNMGRYALTRFLDDPEGSPESLRLAVSDVFKSEDRETVVAEVYRSSTPATRIASLASELGKLADSGDPKAIAQIQGEFMILAQILIGHLKQVRASDPSWVVYQLGGLWDAHPYFLGAFRAALSLCSSDRDLRLEHSAVEPAAGAVLLARQLI